MVPLWQRGLRAIPHRATSALRKAVFDFQIKKSETVESYHKSAWVREVRLWKTVAHLVLSYVLLNL